MPLGAYGERISLRALGVCDRASWGWVGMGGDGWGWVGMGGDGWGPRGSAGHSAARSTAVHVVRQSCEVPSRAALITSHLGRGSRTDTSRGGGEGDLSRNLDRASSSQLRVLSSWAAISWRQAKAQSAEHALALLSLWRTHKSKRPIPSLCQWSMVLGFSSKQIEFSIGTRSRVLAPAHVGRR